MLANRYLQATRSSLQRRHTADTDTDTDAGAYTSNVYSSRLGKRIGKTAATSDRDKQHQRRRLYTSTASGECDLQRSTAAQRVYARQSYDARVIAKQHQ